MKELLHHIEAAIMYDCPELQDLAAEHRAQAETILPIDWTRTTRSKIVCRYAHRWITIRPDWDGVTITVHGRGRRQELEQVEEQIRFIIGE